MKLKLTNNLVKTIGLKKVLINLLKPYRLSEKDIFSLTLRERELLHFKKLYKERNFFRQREYPKIFIFFVDGTGFHGGLNDRFKGIISSFAFCLIKNIPFKISHSSPFYLDDFLLPNDYNWILNKEDICSNKNKVKFISLIGDGTINKLSEFTLNKQTHIYANRDVIAELNNFFKTNYEWGDLFNQLFKPSEKLAQIISEKKEFLGKQYISIVFRFQNLLNDFKEYYFQPLSVDAQQELILKCKDSIVNIGKIHNSKKIFVTSDSTKFLQALINMDNTITFPNKVVHFDTENEVQPSVYMNSFVDFFLIADSSKVYSVANSQMYISDFPKYAAKLNKIPFERIFID